MHPVICQIGPLTIYSFGLMFLAAVVVCSFLLARDAARRYKIPSEETYDFIFWTVMAGVLGARLFFIALNFSFFMENPVEMIKFHKGGLAWQGGLVFGVVVGILYARRLKLTIGALADLVAPYLALGQAIGRLGCFLNGCCYGLPVAWGIYFPVHQARLHPTQLYDFVGLLGIFFILKIFSRTSRPSGQVFTLYLVLAALERFLNEFFRADHTIAYAGLSIFQLFSLAFFVLGLFLWFFLSQRRSAQK